MKAIGGCLLLVAAGVVVTVLLWRPPHIKPERSAPSAAEESLPRVEQATQKASVEVRADLHGDPLPPGAIARLGTVRFMHNSAVYDLAFSPG